ncbi:MAG: hypothetical protein COA33_004635 [Fluviicola sp.]|nr:hypothetical protein [Fluviicola sp.]
MLRQPSKKDVVSPHPCISYWKRGYSRLRLWTEALEVHNPFATFAEKKYSEN